MFSLHTNIRRNLAIGLLFALCLIFFINRGPYRALRFHRSGDFATVYAASRCWMRGEDPYNRATLSHQLAAAGAPLDLIEEQDRHLSLYFVSAMPFFASVAWLPWTGANIAWCILSLACFAASVLALLQHLPVSTRAKWIAASACLLFSPTYVGIVNGNPSVVVISFVILAIHFALRRQDWIAGLLLAATLCIKPQLSVPAICVFVLWKYWRPLLAAFAVLLVVAGASVLQASSFGHKWQWFESDVRNIRIGVAPGGLTDPTPSSPYAAQLLNAQTVTSMFTRRGTADELVWILAGVLAVAYIRLRGKLPKTPYWSDVGFFSALAIAFTYHRYYDGQMLLVFLPLSIRAWTTGQRKIAISLAVCLALIGFPTQSVFARMLGPAATVRSLRQFVLLRYQPVAVIAICVILVFAVSRLAERVQRADAPS